DAKRGNPVKLKIRAELGFMNNKAPMFFNRKAIHVCFLAERSDGHLIDFRRISAKKLNNGSDILLSAELLQQSHFVTCYVMCDEIAGTMRYAELRPNLAPSLFSSRPCTETPGAVIASTRGKVPKPHPNSSSPPTIQGDEGLFDEYGVADEDMFEAGQCPNASRADNPAKRFDKANQIGFSSVESFEAKAAAEALRLQTRGNAQNGAGETSSQEWVPTQLDNGKWECNHKCKDKKACKHLCCHEGVDKPPKRPKQATTTAVKQGESESKSKASKKQTTLPAGPESKNTMAPKAKKQVETVDLAQSRNTVEYAKVAPRAYRSLHKLHEKTKPGGNAAVASNTKPTFSFKKGEQPKFTFLGQRGKVDKENEDGSSDYGAAWIDDLPSPSALLRQEPQAKESLGNAGSRRNRSSAEHEVLPAQESYQDDADSVVDQEDIAGLFTDIDFDEATALSGHEEGPTVSQYFDEGVSRGYGGRSDEKLFISTDSPEKPSSRPISRKASGSFGSPPEAAFKDDTIPSAKRIKLDSTGSIGILEPTVDTGNEAVPPPSAAGPGCSDWMNEFDATAMAEWERYVEFV
ncbi:MAG: hypothetical protein Q9183_004789, partial [Haloplaca sp. 2 TL-2023]